MDEINHERYFIFHTLLSDDILYGLFHFV